MTTLYQRIQTLFRAHVHRSLDQMEDPQLMLEQVLRDMDGQVQRAKIAVINAIASEKVLHRQVIQFQNHIDHWECQAKAAMKNNREDLCRQALARKVEIDTNCERLQRSWQDTRQLVDQLKQQLENLELKRQHMERQRATWMARQQAADARVLLENSRGGFDQVLYTDEQMQRMENKINKAEAYASAVAEIHEQNNSLEDQIRFIEHQKKIDQAYSELKKQVEV